MNIKKITLSFFLLLSIPLFSQETAESKGIAVMETRLSYLDSIKHSFVNDDIASCVDSLWVKELTNLDLYKDINTDIENINTDEKVDYELPTELLKSRLEAMNAKSPFNIQYNQGLENIIKSFLKNRKKSFERLMAISDYYFPMFEETFARQNVPLEIKYLAIVESALNPKAVSRMGATGLWQFMYHTGKQYNLKIDSYVDERSDPLKATQAAAQYMSNMFAIFGDWELVLASYNSGPGNVSKAIRRSGGQQNFWSIKKHLPKETQGYVPAFLATMYLYEYHNEHGIKPNKAIIQHFETDTVMIKKQMSFQQIANLLDVPVSQLQLLNPSYKLNVIPYYKDQNHFLRLPKNKIGVFISNEEKIYAYLEHESNQKNNNPYIKSATTEIARVEAPTYPVGSTTQYYKIKQGDNLSSIADEYNVSVSDLKTWNKLSSNTISYGKVLTIITAKNNTAIAAADTKTSKTEKVKKEFKADTLIASNKTNYIVQKGDNLSDIAEANNVTVAQIKEWNDLDGTIIKAGTSLKIAEKEVEAKEVAATTVAPELKNIEYTVQKGDNLGTISKKFGTAIADLKDWNHLSDTNIALGKTLIVAKNEIAINTAKATAASFKKNSNDLQHDYLVKKGDSLFSIAKKYAGVSVSDIKKWNDINNEDIKPGMRLKIGE
ncbi:membrane-bound lytic murein transglycosylase D [Flavobacterium flevense]|uniref:Lytic transglycosylase n=1 Tax=Flavobacterium flevense TaxID=983 RepID=A0A4Y4AW58_9FLAO|nr:LysM peptidoglycan-binding domain-containing protein [Flavobacterium flevense]GEC70794.1 lytic transglycosylase [Flavobacterium flevense]SHL53368.1 membrane-bound lytic murein transglycosylase D [Flavobacterium flevense]